VAHEDVRDERRDRADHESGRAAKRVSGEEHDVGGRLRGSYWVLSFICGAVVIGAAVLNISV
jgi:hypothetical protein